ncbi:MAG: peroxidase [Planctomycetota bacterium]
MNSQPTRAWIKTISFEDASDGLKTQYRRVLDPQSGRLDAIMEVHSLHPAGLKAHFGLYAAVMRGNVALSAADREMIALVVSKLNDCHY